MGILRTTRLFDPQKKPLRIAVLFSGGASSARYVLQECRKHSSVAKKLKFVGAFSDSSRPRGLRTFEMVNYPTYIVDYAQFMEKNKKKGNERAWEEYFSRVLKEVGEWKPDVLMLSGFMNIVREPLLSEFKNRILNVHPADLTLKENGKIKYVGKNAVMDAVLAGEPYTRSSVHLVTKNVDCGPLVAVSKKFSVDKERVREMVDRGGKKGLKRYVELLQDKMKWEGDGPAFLKALELYADGKLAVKRGKAFIKENGKWKHGFFDLETGAVKNY